MNSLTRHRRALLIANANSLDIKKLVFSYTGTYTDELMTIDGVNYRVLELKSNGTLTMDQLMIDEAIPFDVWCVRQGETGYDGKDRGTSTTSTGVHVSHTGTGPNKVHTTKYADGANGSNGGWSMVLGAIATNLSYTASVSTTAYLNGIISVSDYSRSGTAWFSLPSSNNGAGGAGGDGAESSYCEGCDYSYNSDATSGSPGTPGIVVIRIAINQ